MENLFVYGTLQDPHIQQTIFGRLIEGQPDALADYHKFQIRLGGQLYPIISPAAGSQVEGLLLRVTPAELQRADDYETDDYQRVKVNLTSGIKAWVYQEPAG
jgi:gamma-glutamylcyclotransferase (GGCT)/AIG2-like uncharacterized protein YtfP